MAVLILGEQLGVFSNSGNCTVIHHETKTVERTGAVVKPRTFGREVPGSSPPVAVRCGLE